jgi:hypothetical protein
VPAVRYRRRGQLQARRVFALKQKVKRMEARQPVVIRTWRRDGTTNVMDLDVAIENLSRDGADLVGPDSERREILRKALLAGETLSTSLASFTIE